MVIKILIISTLIGLILSNANASDYRSMFCHSAAYNIEKDPQAFSSYTSELSKGEIKELVYNIRNNKKMCQRFISDMELNDLFKVIDGATSRVLITPNDVTIKQN